MAAPITDHDIQGLQTKVKNTSEDPSKIPGDTIKVDVKDSNGKVIGVKDYRLIDKESGVTQAISVAL